MSKRQPWDEARSRDWTDDHLGGEGDEWDEREAVASGVYPRVSRELIELEGLLERLRTRFVDEERTEGLIGYIADMAPHHHRRLVHLRSEHVLLLTWGELLGEQGAGFDRNTFSAELRAFAEAVCAHEDAEVAILQDALLTDIGVVD